MVWKIAPKNLDKVNENELSRKAYSMLLKWVGYANTQYKDWKARPNCGHFFGGAYWYGLETSQTAMAFATAAVYGEYDETVTGISRDEAKTKAIKAIRYLGFTHDTGPEDCVREETANPHCSRTKWGGKNDGFFQASQHGVPVFSFGMAAWILWEYLDDETRVLVQNVVSSYADRWSREQPRNGVYFDTQTEENGWTGIGISIAAIMFPEHENNGVWREGAMKWLLNTSTTYLDRFDGTKYKGKPLAGGWITNITTHPDFTAENHGFVHPNYMSAGILFKDHVIMADIIAGNETDPVIFRLWDEVYDRVLKPWTSAEGVTVPIQGQDWWYNQLASNIEIHAAASILRGSRDAAYLERAAMEMQSKIQESNGNGCFLEADGDACRITQFQTAKDMEHQAAARLAHTYLLHVYCGMGSAASTQKEFSSNTDGLYYYPYGSSIVYRTEKSLTSFSWRNCAMALTLPEKGLWTITALPASYFGTVKMSGTASNPFLSNEKTILFVRDENISIYEQGFAASARIPRGDNELLQDVAFAALPDGRTVYFEKFTANKDCSVEEIRTGLIGIRNEKYSELPETAKGYKSFYINGRLADTFYGYYGTGPDRRVCWNEVNTVNLDDEIGYLVYNSNQVEYFNKHVYPKWKGVEDILTLNYYDKPVEFKAGQEIGSFILVTLPNADNSKTEKASTGFSVLNTGLNNADAVLADEYLVYNNRGYCSVNITAITQLTDKAILLFEGYNRFEADIKTYSWKGRVNRRASGWLKAAFSITPVSSSTAGSALAIEADITAEDRAVLHNISGEKSEFEVKALKSEKTFRMVLEPGEYKAISID